MKTPLMFAEIASIYFSHGVRQPLGSRMARCTPDTLRALRGIDADLNSRGGHLFLSDLFRSYEMQYQANMDYRSGKKKAYSPPPGGSMHEAGRAFDLDLEALKIPLREFWKIAAKHGVYPIINTPDSGLSEAWHFDCRGSHHRVFGYYSAGKGSNMPPYTAMAVSAILAIDQKVDRVVGKLKEASIQTGLIRLGYEVGDIDGVVGMKTRAALKKAKIGAATIDGTLLAVDDLLQKAFPDEFHMGPMPEESQPPDHLVG